MAVVSSQRVFVGVTALLFLGSAAVTTAQCISMSSMDMTMPGGWTMSMAWMRMAGQTWLGSAASFLGMWTVMMVAMMLPCLVPMLVRYRRQVSSRAGLSALVGSGYYLVWILIGAAIYPIGAALGSIEMQQSGVARVVPLAEAAVVLLAGLLQFSGWKTRHLACCREASAPSGLTSAASAWRHGLRMGLHCSYCCFGLMAILIAVGVMDLKLMTVLTVAMAVERLAPSGGRAARVIGVTTVVAALYLAATALV